MSKLTDRLRDNDPGDMLDDIDVQDIRSAADIIDELAVALAKLTDICERQPRFHKLIPAKDSPLGLARTALSKLESLSNE